MRDNTSTEPSTVEALDAHSEHAEIKEVESTPYPTGLTWCKLTWSKDKWGLIDRIKRNSGIEYYDIGEFVGEYAVPYTTRFNAPARLVKRNGERWEYGYVMCDFINTTERVIIDILMYQREMQKRKDAAQSVDGSNAAVVEEDSTPTETITVDAGNEQSASSTVEEVNTPTEPVTVDAAPDANINSEHSDTANNTPSTAGTANDTVDRVNGSNNIVDARNAVASSEPSTVEEVNANAAPFVYEMEHRAAANEEVNTVDGGDTTVASALSVDTAEATVDNSDADTQKQSPAEKRAAVAAAIISDKVIPAPPTVDGSNEEVKHSDTTKTALDARISNEYVKVLLDNIDRIDTNYYCDLCQTVAWASLNTNEQILLCISHAELLEIDCIQVKQDFNGEFKFYFCKPSERTPNVFKAKPIPAEYAWILVKKGQARFVDYKPFSYIDGLHRLVITVNAEGRCTLYDYDDAMQYRSNAFRRNKTGRRVQSEIARGDKLVTSFLAKDFFAYAYDGTKLNTPARIAYQQLGVDIDAETTQKAMEQAFEKFFDMYDSAIQLRQNKLSAAASSTVDAVNEQSIIVDATNEETLVDAANEETLIGSAPSMDINSEHSDTANNTPSTGETVNDTVDRVDAANNAVDARNCDTADVVKLLNAYEASAFKFRFWMNVNGNNMSLVISKAYDTLNDEYHQAMADLRARGVTPSTSDAYVKARDAAEKTADIVYKKSKKTRDRLDAILNDVLDGVFVYVPQWQCDLTIYDAQNEDSDTPLTVDVAIDRFDDDDCPDDDSFFDVTPIDDPNDDDELVDSADTKEVIDMFAPTIQLLLPAPKMATLLLPAPAFNINSDSADACDDTPNKIDTVATVNALKTQAADARIALELANFKARLDKITANFNIGIAALDECQTFAPRSHKGAIVEPQRQRLTGRRRKKTNAEQLKALATPLIEQIAAIRAEFQNDNAAPKTLNGSNNAPPTVETIDDVAEHVDASNGVVGFNSLSSETAKKALSDEPRAIVNKSVLAFDSVLQSIKFGLIAALAVFAHFNTSHAVTNTTLALASVFTVELVIKFCWLFAACSKAEERKGDDVGEIAPSEVKRLNRQPYNPLTRARSRKSAWAIRERQAAPS